MQALILLGAALSALAVVLVLVQGRSATDVERSRQEWLVAGLVLTAIPTVVASVLSVLVDWPDRPAAGFAVGCVTIPVAFGLSRSRWATPYAGAVLVNAIVVGGLIGVVGGIYLLVVIGLGKVPEGDERGLLVLSMAAAAISCIVAVPAKRRLEEWANQRIHGERHSPEEALRTFGGRMSRAVPMDELLLQLVETLKKTMRLTAAEIWTGTDGRLTCSVSVPDRGPDSFVLDREERDVVARAHAQGPAWVQVWVPGLLEGREGRTVRTVSVAHLGELLGLIVVERHADDAGFSEEEDRVLVELARQVGLALHNVRLDSALQASLDELRVRNEQLVASRARIVTAADESRRQIERNLHDGAQQHLVALAVKVGLVRNLMNSDPETATTMLEELRGDVQATLTELRELAHGIYPPLLRDRGIPEALQNAANRASLPTVVTAEGIGRYDTDVEAAIYFCCLEALQNAGKHAGEGATITIAVGADDDTLWFEVTDDGEGFDASGAASGHGFVNMADRLGAYGGEMNVTSVRGEGTTVRGTVSATPLPTASASPGTASTSPGTASTSPGTAA